MAENHCEQWRYDDTFTLIARGNVRGEIAPSLEIPVGDTNPTFHLLIPGSQFQPFHSVEFVV